MKISVFGLGYVGMVNIACLSKLGHHMYGCDIKQQKVDILKAGESTVFEPGVTEMTADAMAKGLISATNNAQEAISNSDVALICVGTPSDSEGKVNLSYVLNTTQDIIKVINKENKPFTIIYRSTIPPGTINDFVLPAIKEGLNPGVTMPDVVFLPEFLREGNAVIDFFECARIVAGIDEGGSARELLTELFTFSKDVPIFFTNYRTAEFVKYVDNAYHATKVAFANEIYSIGSTMGVDVSKANELFLMDEILNISKKYLRPGMPYGGSCLPKDIRALISMGEKYDVAAPFINNVAESNRAHQERILNKVLDFNADKISLYGITFKQDTDDIRESPFVFLLEALAQKGKSVKFYDERVNLNHLRIEAPHLFQYATDDMSEVENSELIIINSKNYEDLLSKLDSSTKVLNCLNNEDLSTHSVKVANLY